MERSNEQLVSTRSEVFESYMASLMEPITPIVRKQSISIEVAKRLAGLATELDRKGAVKEANFIDAILKEALLYQPTITYYLMNVPNRQLPKQVVIDKYVEFYGPKGEETFNQELQQILTGGTVEESDDVDQAGQAIKVLKLTDKFKSPMRPIEMFVPETDVPQTAEELSKAFREEKGGDTK